MVGSPCREASTQRKDYSVLGDRKILDGAGTQPLRFFPRRKIPRHFPLPSQRAQINRADP